MIFNRNRGRIQRGNSRYEQIKDATAGADHKEKLLLVHLIENYENNLWDLPEVNPVEMIKIRMDDFGYKAADLANVYGDKGTISKVLNYKQHLSLTMIRKLANFYIYLQQNCLKNINFKIDLIKTYC